MNLAGFQPNHKLASISEKASELPARSRGRLFNQLTNAVYDMLGGCVDLSDQRLQVLAVFRIKVLA